MDRSNGLSIRFANMCVICALMVVMIHVLKRPQIPGSFIAHFRTLTGEGVCRIAVPFFFFAAGYFIARHLDEIGYWRREVSKRIKSLLIPFVAWAVISGVVCSFIMIAFHQEGVLRIGRALRLFGLYPFAVPELRQTWFLRVLFVFMLLLPMFKMLATKCGILLLAVLYIIVKPFGFLFLTTDVWMLLNFGLFSVEGAVYFAMGIFMQRSKVKLLAFRPLIGLVVTLLGLLVMLALRHIPHVSKAALQLAIPIMILGVFMLMPTRPIAGRFQGDSFKLYLVHLIVVFVYFATLDSCLLGDVVYYLDPGRCLLGVCVCFFVVVALSLGVIAILKTASNKSVVLRTLLWGGR